VNRFGVQAYPGRIPPPNSMPVLKHTSTPTVWPDSIGLSNIQRWNGADWFRRRLGSLVDCAPSEEYVAA